MSKSDRPKGESQGRHGDKGLQASGNPPRVAERVRVREEPCCPTTGTC